MKLSLISTEGQTKECIGILNLILFLRVYLACLAIGLNGSHSVVLDNGMQ